MGGGLSEKASGLRLPGGNVAVQHLTWPLYSGSFILNRRLSWSYK
jgi:hypothetical protein